MNNIIPNLEQTQMLKNILIFYPILLSSLLSPITSCSPFFSLNLRFLSPHLFLLFQTLPLSSFSNLAMDIGSQTSPLRLTDGDGFCNYDCEWVWRWWHFLFLNTLSLSLYVTFFIGSQLVFCFLYFKTKSIASLVRFFFPYLIFRIESITLSSMFHVLLPF